MERDLRSNLNKFIVARDDFESKYQYNNEYNIHNLKNEKAVSRDLGLWRYMSFSKFVSLLETSAIFFSKPSGFLDPYEGSFSHSDLERFLGEYIYWNEKDRKAFIDGVDQVYARAKIALDYVGISCWHMNNEESAAMWDLYCRRDEGIAIKTSVNNLIKSYSFNEYDICYGVVNYIDYEKDMAGTNSYDTLFYKRKSFSHEQEFRMLVFDDEEELFFGPAGVNVTFNLNTLINEIYVSPTSPPWFKDTVQAIVNRYGLGKKVIQSNLYQGPYIVS